MIRMNRNLIKRVLAVIMALVVVVSGIIVHPKTAEAATKKPTSITLNATTKTLYTSGGAKTFTLKVTSSKPSSASRDVRFSSNRGSVASVNRATGVVTAKKKGTATITATSKADSKVKAQCKVTVKQRVTGITLNKSSVSIKKGDKLTLRATVRPSNANNRNVTWKSSKSGVASVNSKGTVTAKKAGTATITVNTKDGSRKTAKCVVGVYTKTVTSATINRSALSLNVGKTSTLKVAVNPKGASSVYKWTSNKKGIASVDAAGKVTAKKAGTATITGKPSDGSKASKAVVTCKVTVTQPVTGISIEPGSKTLAVNETVQLKAIVAPTDASTKSVEWTSSDTSKATVSTSGLVTAKAEGAATITAVAADRSGKSASCTIKVTKAVNEDPVVKENQKLTIIHVNDVHGYAEETNTSIGYAKLAALIDRMKEEDPNTIALDAGDTFAGSQNTAFDKGESILKILNTVAFDAMVLGNNDLLLGSRLPELTGRLNYKALAGNVMSASGGDRIWDAYTIITLENGLKVGIVTATYNFLEYHSDPIESLQSQVDEIRADTDVIVALTHLGLEDEIGSKVVANEVKGIDVIIDGHSHTVLTEGVEVNGILIAQTGDYSKNIGITELIITEGAVTSASSHLITKNEMDEANTKEETLAATAELQEGIAAYNAEVIGATTVDLNGSRADIRTKETNLGNLYADAVRAAAEADIALCCAATIGDVVIPEGNITRGDVLTICRITTDYFVGEMKGSDIVKAMEAQIYEYPKPAGLFLQVSGISFKIDPNKLVGERIHSVYVGGEPIDPEQTYTVVFPDLVEAYGYGNAINTRTILPEITNIVEEYIKEQDTISLEVEGRIVVEAISE